MKVICDRGALLDAINLVSGAVAARSPRPQLGCVKLVATKHGGAGELTLSATDAEIALKLSLSQVDVQKAGEALVPADKLRSIVAAEEGEPTLTLELDGEALHIKGADAHFKVYGYPAAEFPPIPDFAAVVAGTGDAPKAKATITHPSGSLSQLVARTLFATARENSRYAINGVLFKRDGKRLEMVATDGRRLALARANLTGGEKDAKGVSCIIPTKALGMLQKLISQHEEPVQIAITDAQIFFSFGTAASPGRACSSPTSSRARSPLRGRHPQRPRQEGHLRPRRRVQPRSAVRRSSPTRNPAACAWSSRARTSSSSSPAGPPKSVKPRSPSTSPATTATTWRSASTPSSSSMR